MKIYEVWVGDGSTWGRADRIAAFTSKEKAEEYINTKAKRLHICCWIETVNVG